MESRVKQSGAFYYVVQDTLRVLFADDDPILREFAAVHLATETATVDTAEDGVACLERIAAQAPDILLLDLEMPRMDGFEVLRSLRADPATQHLPVVVVTGREDVAAIDRAFEAGATSFVAKPLNWRLLSYQVRYVHRTHCNEMALLEERARAKRQAEDAQDRLARVAAESSRFLATALAAHPDLRLSAQCFADELHAAVLPPTDTEAA